MKKIAKISKFLLILFLITGWIFSGWPRIWQNPKIPPKVQEARAAELSTLLLLTAIFAFVNLKVVNPPRAYFGRCGVFIFGKNFGIIGL